MVNVEKSKVHKSLISVVYFNGADANTMYYLLRRLYTRMQGVKVDVFECIPKGTLIFEDELAVLGKLFQ